jgi:hypothetical protein
VTSFTYLSLMTDCDLGLPHRIGRVEKPSFFLSVLPPNNRQPIDNSGPPPAFGVFIGEISNNNTDNTPVDLGLLFGYIPNTRSTSSEFSRSRTRILLTSPGTSVTSGYSIFVAS